MLYENQMNFENTLEFAKKMDNEDPIAAIKNEFSIPAVIRVVATVPVVLPRAEVLREYVYRAFFTGLLGDVNLAEPHAIHGFAGPRVIEQTVRQKLPEGFQRSEFLLDHGAVDMIVDRRQMREQIAELLAKFENRPSPVK